MSQGDTSERGSSQERSLRAAAIYLAVGAFLTVFGLALIFAQNVIGGAVAVFGGFLFGLGISFRQKANKPPADPADHTGTPPSSP